MGESFGVAAFRSRQQVMRMNDWFRKEGLKTSVVSTPREISAGCGLSIRFDLKDLSSVRRATTAARPSNMIGLYRVDAKNGQKSSLSALTMRE